MTEKTAEALEDFASLYGVDVDGGVLVDDGLRRLEKQGHIERLDGDGDDE